MHGLTAVLLAVIQGLTEFIPISSSGHLAVTQFFLKFEEPPVAFDVVLHLGTLFAVLVYYRRDLGSMLRVWQQPIQVFRPDWKSDNPGKLMILLLISCVPTALIGFFLKEPVENAFGSLNAVGWGFLLGGGIMFLTALKKSGAKTVAEMKFTDALIIGVFQGIALFPGVSRSGTTISAALFLGIAPVQAGRFSFLLSVPAILGAIVLQARTVQVQIGTPEDLALYAVSGVIAGIVGYFSIRPLLRVLQALKFHYFAMYCWVAGLFLLVYLWATT